MSWRPSPNRKDSGRYKDDVDLQLQLEQELRVGQFTAEELGNEKAVVNRVGKYAGKKVWCVDKKAYFFAEGSEPHGAWVNDVEFIGPGGGRFAGGLVNKAQGLGGGIFIPDSFFGGLGQQAQSLDGELARNAAFFGGVGNSLQGFSGSAIATSGYVGKVSNAAQGFSGVITNSSAFPFITGAELPFLRFVAQSSPPSVGVGEGALWISDGTTTGLCNIRYTYDKGSGPVTITIVVL